MPLADPTVVGQDDHAVVESFDARGACPLEQVHAPAQEVRLERGRHLGILLGQHLLAADDQGHVSTEGGEHVHELDAGDARADHHDMGGDVLGGG